jgi:hypothetical protein
MRVKVFPHARASTLKILQTFEREILRHKKFFALVLLVIVIMSAQSPSPPPRFTSQPAINNFLLKVKSNVQASPLLAKTLIYYSVFAAIPLNVVLKLDEKCLFTPYDVVAKFQWYRVFASFLYVNSGVFGALFNAFISYRFVSDFERSLGSFRCFWQLAIALVLTNCWTLVFSVAFAPFFGGHLLSPLNISGPGVLSATFAMCMGNIARNSSGSGPDATTMVLGVARVPNSWLPFVFLFLWYVLGNNLVEGCSCVFVALRYLPRACGPSGVPSAVQTKRFESTTRIGHFFLETHGYVDVDGSQRGFTIPVRVGSSGTSGDYSNSNPERASFSGTSHKVGSSNNTSGVPALRESVHVVRMREERERKQQQQQQQQQQQLRAAADQSKQEEEDEQKIATAKPESREARARIVAEAMEKRLQKEKEEKSATTKEEEPPTVATTPTAANAAEQQQQQQQQKKKKPKLRSPFRRGDKNK